MLTAGIIACGDDGGGAPHGSTGGDVSSSTGTTRSPEGSSGQSGADTTTGTPHSSGGSESTGAGTRGSETGGATTTADDTTAGASDDTTAGTSDDTTGTTGTIDCTCGAQVDAPYFWITNPPQATLSKIHLETLVEEARYLTQAGGVGEPQAAAVSVDNRYVAVASTEGTVSQFWTRTEDCEESNGRDRIQTSTGPADVLPYATEECRRWDAASDLGAPRAIAWAAGSQDEESCEYHAQRLWLTTCNAGIVNVAELDPDVGETLSIVVIVEAACNEALSLNMAVDADGVVWVVQEQIGGRFVRLDPDTLEYELSGTPFIPHDIGVDASGRVWVTSNNGKPFGAARYDPVSELWEVADSVPLGGVSAIAQAPSGEMWMTYRIYDGDASMPGPVSIDPDRLTISEGFDLCSTAGCPSLAVDAQGRVWIADRDADEAYRFDPTGPSSETITGLVAPRTTGDLTGEGLRNVACPGDR